MYDVIVAECVVCAIDSALRCCMRRDSRSSGCGGE